MFFSGNNIPTSPKGRKSSSLLLLSGFFVALSYLLTLCPLAMYGLSQFSAIFGKWRSFLLSIAVMVFISLLAFVLGSPSLIGSALLVLVSIPFFFLSMFLRERLYSWIWAVVVLAAPLCLLFLSLVFAPVLSETQFANTIAAVKVSFEQNKLKEQNGTPLQSQERLQEKYDKVSKELDFLSHDGELKHYLTTKPATRMAWLVFGSGSMMFFFALLTTFGCILFLDLAYEQIEKLRAVFTYVISNFSQFPMPFVTALLHLPLDFLAGKKTIDISSHETMRANNTNIPSGDNVKVVNLSFLKPYSVRNQIFLRGYLFRLSGKVRSWNLRYFSLPFGLSFASIFYLLGMMLWFGGQKELLVFLDTSPMAFWFAAPCVISFVVISILVLQGALTFYARISNFIGFLVLLGLFFFSNSIDIGFYLWVAFFASVGLLDEVYDWRFRKIRN